MKGRMVLAAAPIGKLRVGGRSRRNAGFRRWKRPVSASSHSGLAAPDYDFALGIGDELVSYTIKKPRKSAVRYFAHANHLYSVAAIISATGSVVERWSYNVYGVPTIKNSANATIAKSAVGNDRGFTGYKLDSESGLYFARARMYSAKLGLFTGRDPDVIFTGHKRNSNNEFDFAPGELGGGFSEASDDFQSESVEEDLGYNLLRDSILAQQALTRLNSANELPWRDDLVTFSPSPMDGYHDGMRLYGAHFAPNHTDPSGKRLRWLWELCKKLFKKKCKPCIPPVGTINYRTDYPPSPAHNGIPTPHSHAYIMNQSPPAAGCKCFWVSVGKDPLPGVHNPQMKPAGGGGVK